MLTFTQNKELEYLANSLPQIVWTSEADGNLDYFNNAWYQYTGLSYEQSIGLGLHKVLHPDEKEETVRRWKKSFEQGTDFEMQYRIKNHQGEYKWFLARAIPMKDELGNIIKWFGTCTYIQEQVETKQKLEQTNAELINVSKDLDDFIFTATHELRAPTSNLEGLLTTFAQSVYESLDEDDKKMMDMMFYSVDQLNNITNNLVKIVEVQNERKLVVSKCDIESIVLDTQKRLIEDIRESHSLIEIHLEENFLNCSEDVLKNILYNLLSNAIKFRDFGRRNIIRISSFRENGHTALCIEDNGLGFDLFHKNKLFSMYKRFNTHVEGVGVGLYIVKRQTESMGGRVEVQSKTGFGTQYKLIFPEN